MNPMYLKHIKELRREHNDLLNEASRILKAVEALETLVHSPVHQRQSQPIEKHNRLSPKARRRLSRMMKLRWAQGKMQRSSKHRKKPLHWTQKPKNRARVLQLIKKATAARR